MRTRTTFVGSIVIAMAAVAGIAHATTIVMKQRFSGSQAFALFQINQNITCAGGGTGSVFAFGNVSGADQIFTQKGGGGFNGNGTFVEIDSYSNTCTNTSFGSAAGGVTNGYVPPDNRLTSARSTGSGTIQDFSTALTYSVTLNLTYTGIGPTNLSKSNSQSRTLSATGAPLTMSHSHFENENRGATVSGTITLEGFALTPTMVFAELVSNDNAEVDITK